MISTTRLRADHAAATMAPGGHPDPGQRLLADPDHRLDGIIMTNRAGVVTELNRAAVLLTDWAEDRALGKTLASVLSLRQRVTGDAPADPALTAMADNEALAPVLDCQLQRRDGALLPLLYAARPVRGARGFVAGALVVFAWLTRNGVVFRQPGPAG